MKKIILTLAIVLAAHFMAAPAIAELDGTPLPSLRGHSEVDDNYIRLGDLFANLPEDQREISVAYAPKPAARQCSTRSGCIGSPGITARNGAR